MHTIDGQDGLYDMEQTIMAFGPQRYMVPRFVLPNTYGRMEREEAAARFIVLCQERGEWVGVAVPRYFAPINEEMHVYFQRQEELLRDVETLRREYVDQLASWHTEVKRWKLRRMLTLGLYTVRCPKPERPDSPDYSSIERDESSVFSGVPMFGPNFLMEGLAELADKGYIRVERDSENDWDVMFPEPKLLEPIGPYLIPA